MTDSEITDVLHAYLIGELVRDRSIEEVDPDDNLFTTGILDSMAIAQMVQYIETAFEIRIPPIDFTLENFMSLQSMSQYISGRASGS